MSNAETIRAIFEAFNRRKLDPVLPLFHPDVELINRIAALEGRSYLGRPGMFDFQRDIEATWSEFQLSLEDIVTEGDSAVAVYRVHSVTRDSGIAVDQRIAIHLGFQGGMVSYGRVYSAPAEAFEAAGLEPPS
jgi:ketosteroid isomerase-like protein